MLKLCGFAVSNYYNKVKIALIEKDIPFTEELVWTSQKPEMLARSPMGKVPFLETGHGTLSESSVINEYLEEAYPAKPLFPADPWQRAKVRELVNLLDMHLELNARRLYPQAFFGGSISDETRDAVKGELEKGVRALQALARFSPFIAGDQLTYADCSAFVHLPLVSAATKKIYGADMLEAIPQVKAYLAMMKARPHLEKVEADRKANLAEMAARFKS
ncbi:MAG: glutathione S-transferase family protein [Burkholderiales bacterium]|nr:glutathione S-transferase family protein [Burkholderiales bacterium]